MFSQLRSFQTRRPTRSQEGHDSDNWWRVTWQRWSSASHRGQWEGRYHPLRHRCESAGPLIHLSYMAFTLWVFWWLINLQCSIKTPQNLMRWPHGVQSKRVSQKIKDGAKNTGSSWRAPKRKLSGSAVKGVNDLLQTTFFLVCAAAGTANGTLDSFSGLVGHLSKNSEVIWMETSWIWWPHWHRCRKLKSSETFSKF